MDKQIVVYKTVDDIRLEVQTDGETVWLTQEQMCRLFGRERSVITKHIANIFKEGELEREVVCAKFAHTTFESSSPSMNALFAFFPNEPFRSMHFLLQKAHALFQQFLRRQRIFDADVVVCRDPHRRAQPTERPLYIG